MVPRFSPHIVWAFDVLDRGRAARNQRGEEGERCGQEQTLHPHQMTVIKFIGTAQYATSRAPSASECGTPHAVHCLRGRTRPPRRSESPARAAAVRKQTMVVRVPRSGPVTTFSRGGTQLVAALPARVAFARHSLRLSHLGPVQPGRTCAVITVTTAHLSHVRAQESDHLTPSTC